MSGVAELPSLVPAAAQLLFLWAGAPPQNALASSDALPPSWVLGSYFESFGRWLLSPKAAEPPGPEEERAIAAGKGATVTFEFGAHLADSSKWLLCRLSGN